MTFRNSENLAGDIFFIYQRGFSGQQKFRLLSLNIQPEDLNKFCNIHLKRNIALIKGEGSNSFSTSSSVLNLNAKN